MKSLLRVAGLFALLSAPVLAGDVPAPKIPPVPAEKGEQCVEPTDVMRRSHMEFILHERDETVYGGIRGRKHSLEGCIDCHVSKDENGNYPSSESEEHFCSSCHTYAAVKIDCFQCHVDYPVEETAKFSSMNIANPHTAMNEQEFKPLATELIVEGSDHE